MRSILPTALLSRLQWRISRAEPGLQTDVSPSPFHGVGMHLYPLSLQGFNSTFGFFKNSVGEGNGNSSRETLSLCTALGGLRPSAVRIVLYTNQYFCFYGSSSSLYSSFIFSWSLLFSSYFAFGLLLPGIIESWD